MAVVLAWLEQTWLSLWIRESATLWAFPFVLFLHTLGLGAAAGLSVALNIWLLGLARRYPLAPLQPFFPAVWLAFTLALVSGLLLLLAYPTKALTDPVFYVKIALIVLALWQVQWVRRTLFVQRDPHIPLDPPARARALAAVAIASWAGAVVTGRFLAYTYRYLTAADLPVGP